MSERAVIAPSLDRTTLPELKPAGFSGAQITQFRECTEREVRKPCWKLGARPVYHAVGTCAAEFAARTPYLYSTYDEETEVPSGNVRMPAQAEAEQFCTIRSYLAAARKHSVCFFHTLIQLVEGHPWPPTDTPLANGAVPRDTTDNVAPPTAA